MFVSYNKCCTNFLTKFMEFWKMSEKTKDTKKEQKEVYEGVFSKGIDENGDSCILKLKITDDLKKLLKRAIVSNTTQEFKVNIGYPETTGQQEYINLERYKVKRIVFSALRNSYNCRDVLFSKQLIKEGEIQINFNTWNRLEEFKSYMTSVIHDFLKCFLTTQYEQKVTYNLKLTEEEKEEDEE